LDLSGGAGAGQVGKQLDLDLLNLRQPLPLAGQHVVHLLIQVANLQLRFQVHPVIVLRATAVLFFLAVVARQERSEASVFYQRWAAAGTSARSRRRMAFLWQAERQTPQP
jgi:hypothetical protein